MFRIDIDLWMIARLERRIYPVGGPRKRSPPPSGSGGRDIDPENNPVGKQMRIESNVSTLPSPSLQGSKSGGGD